MKKIYTLLMLALASVMNSFAATTQLWSGSQEFGTGWSDYITLTAAQLADVKEGDVLTIHVTALTVGGQINIQHNWIAFDPEIKYDFVEGDAAGDYTFTLTADQVTTMKADGINVKGISYACDKITLVNSDPEPTTEEIDLTQEMNSAWDASYDTTTKTITWTNAWGGCGWWYGDDGDNGTSKDCSAYTKITYEFAEAAPAGGGLDFQYVSGDAGWAGFNAGDTKVELALDATRSNHVKAIYLKLGDAGSITLSKVYFTKAATPTAINTVKANANNGKAYNLAGQSVDANAKGLVIINGKKVIK